MEREAWRVVEVCGSDAQTGVDGIYEEIDSFDLLSVRIPSGTGIVKRKWIQKGSRDFELILFEQTHVTSLFRSSNSYEWVIRSREHGYLYHHVTTSIDRLPYCFVTATGEVVTSIKNIEYFNYIF